MRKRRTIATITALAFVLASCGGGSSSTTPVVTPPPPPPPPPAPATVFSVPAQESLSTADVQQVIAQAVAEASARNLPSTIAVVDRVGNVLAAFRMNGANDNLTIPINAGRTPTGRDLRGLTLPGGGVIKGAVAGAIAKAVTGAYLSSGGNAFSTRTASQIVQQHFPPAPTTVGLESGPLYGVQFSSLPCSDLAARFASGGGASALIGPKRTPLGLSADSGGLPLYKNGVVVGGVGVMGDGVYGFDPNILDTDADSEEFVALAATASFEAPTGIRADRITVDGTSLRYSDATPAGFRATGTAPGFAAINGPQGALIAVNGYNAGAIVTGAKYGSEASGIRASTAAEFSNRDAFVLTDGSGNDRFPVKAGTDGAAISQPLTLAESRAFLEEAFSIMSRARAQIRQPLDSRAQVTISLVDTYGSVLGVVRSPDAPIFGIDVSLQKARTAAFFSNPNAAADLAANPRTEIPLRLGLSRTFFNDPAIFTGKTAFTNRAIGNIARPFFPDGEFARPPGPLSPPIADFNPFNVGLQSELIFDNIFTHVAFVLGLGPDTPARCTATPDVTPGQNRLQNGIQIFPGSVPIYRGNVLVGAIGVSGDGIDQDDMIGFLGTLNGATKAGNNLSLPPAAIRSDQLVVTLPNSPGVRLRFVGCPFAPFLDTNEQNVCQGR